MTNGAGASYKNKIITVFVFICSVIVIAAGCLLIFMLPSKKDMSANDTDGSQTSSDSSKKLPSEQEQFLDDLLGDISISLTFGKSTEKLDFNSIRDWISVESAGSGFKCAVNDAELYDYTKGLANKYNTFVNRITFTNVYGEDVTLDNMGTGWVFDSDYAAEMIRQYITTGESVSLDLTNRSRESNKWWLRVCADYNAIQLKGDCYAEVSISKQYVWIHKNGKVILESPVVTGNANEGHDTPKGAFIIYEKKSPATLYGPGYITEVSYWMAFFDDIGFHDATWQESFGGDTYLYNGSHGCVNIPLSFAEKLYDVVYKNMPVYVY